MFAECARASLSSLFKLLSFVYLHLDSKCLHQHVDCIVIFSRKWNDDISVLHSWLDEIIVGWFYKFAILSKHVNHSTAAVSNITLDTSGKSNVVWSQHKNFEVHHVSKPLLENSVNALEDDDRCCFYSLHYIRSLVSGKIVSGNQTVFPLE